MSRYTYRPNAITPSLLADRLQEAADAHHAYVAEIAEPYERRLAYLGDNSPRLAELYRQERDAAVAAENKAWVQWYATFLASRLNADLTALQWTPDPVSPFPPYAPVGQADGYSDDVGTIAPNRVGLSRWANVRPLAAYGRAGVDNDNAAE